ncbi:hypothetical protein GP486_005192 [Trichoglossum hirsutum]|uniref:Heterokaryon incompatibility domain-containing protein n=1 Tax=Trichoglossum hirsutum TaxID=265104 RepID=A0A9P8RMQ6_9PEZI|nr:hypothetical protein GP486_005192 [Trichoglossum hirsutum]
MDDQSRNTKKDYRKIEMACQIARQAGLSYAWIDTCCIDKSSSAELTEAINSMYRWYQHSDICYAFLADLPASVSLDTALPHCRWFTRGWTLQELIAPEEIYFFDQDWNNRGSKKDLVECLSGITGIDASVLRREQHLSSVAVAQKMSWAAYRETTRIEDTAYCLLGLFNVNMPLLYGEEEKAFRRLQEEIIKSTADLGIFAWRMPSAARNTKERVFCGVLAETPLAFAGCTSIATGSNTWQREFSVSNIGMKTQIQILSAPIPGTRASRYILPLNCCSWACGRSLGVRLRKCGPDQFIREDPWTLEEYTGYFFPNAPRESYLLTKLPEIETYPDPQTWGMSLFIAKTRSHVLQVSLPLEMQVYDAWPWGRFDDEDQLFFVSGNPRWDSGALRLCANFTSVGRRKTKVEFECMFYAVGWSELEPGRLQCTLVDYRSFPIELREVQSQITTWDHDTTQVLEQLAYHRIPRSCIASFKIAGTKASAVVSLTPTLVSDLSICQNKFWRVEFSCKIYDTEKLSQIDHKGWIVGGIKMR